MTNRRAVVTAAGGTTTGSSLESQAPRHSVTDGSAELWTRIVASTSSLPSTGQLLDAAHPDAAAGFSRTSFDPPIESRLIRNGSDHSLR